MFLSCCDLRDRKDYTVLICFMFVNQERRWGTTNRRRRRTTVNIGWRKQEGYRGDRMRVWWNIDFMLLIWSIQWGEHTGRCGKSTHTIWTLWETQSSVIILKFVDMSVWLRNKTREVGSLQFKW
jgi:hypothetical protein